MLKRIVMLLSLTAWVTLLTPLVACSSAQQCLGQADCLDGQGCYDGLCKALSSKPQGNCKDKPNCNWCAGEVVTDGSGCFVRYKCKNGADPCKVRSCTDGQDCDVGQVCRDELCWSTKPSCPSKCTSHADCAKGCGIRTACIRGACHEPPQTCCTGKCPEKCISDKDCSTKACSSRTKCDLKKGVCVEPTKTCAPTPNCNWCKGQKLTDKDGCFVRFMCSNGADPCKTNPCGKNADCKPGELCFRDGLCIENPACTSPCSGDKDCQDTLCGKNNICQFGRCKRIVKCLPAPPCNWCGGDEVRDKNGCIVGYRCKNGANPCSTQQCTKDQDCKTDETCKSDGLCYPKSKGKCDASCKTDADCQKDCGGIAEKCIEGKCQAPKKCTNPVPSCNWCGGQGITDKDGCFVKFQCKNGADPCKVQPCSPTNPCKSGEICKNQLCWPNVP